MLSIKTKHFRNTMKFICKCACCAALCLGLMQTPSQATEAGHISILPVMLKPNYTMLSSIAIDKTGYSYLTNNGYGHGLIWRIGPDGNVTHLAGFDGIVYSYNRDDAQNHLATSEYLPRLGYSFFDYEGNFLIGVADGIKKMNRLGYVDRIAGDPNGIDLTDGILATQTRFYNLYPVSTDKNKNIYLIDGDKNRILKIDSAGIISTVAGGGIRNSPGPIDIKDGGLATKAVLQTPTYVTNDLDGNLYISDKWNSRIRKVSVNGVISTFAGNGPPYDFNSPYSGEGGLATEASIGQVGQIAVDAFGNIYASIYTDQVGRIVRIDENGYIWTVVGGGKSPLTEDALATSLSLSYGPSFALNSRGDLLFVAPKGIVTVHNVTGPGLYAGQFFPPLSKGDLDGNDKVDLKDVTFALQCAVSKTLPTNEQVQAGDFNGNGSFEMGDVIQILRLAVSSS